MLLDQRLQPFRILLGSGHLHPLVENGAQILRLLDAQLLQGQQRNFGIRIAGGMFFQGGAYQRILYSAEAHQNGPPDGRIGVFSACSSSSPIIDASNFLSFC